MTQPQLFDDADAVPAVRLVSFKRAMQIPSGIFVYQALYNHDGWYVDVHLSKTHCAYLNQFVTRDEALQDAARKAREFVNLTIYEVQNS